MIAGRPIASIPIAGKQAAQSGISGSATTSQAQTIAASGTVTAPAITGTATTSQAQTIAASGTFIALVTGTATTSQAQTAAASGTYTPPLVTGTAATSQAQTTAGNGTFIALVTGTAATSQAQTIAGSGTFTPAGISGTASTSQAQTTQGTGTVSGGETDTHDGDSWKRYRAKLERIVNMKDALEIVQESPEEAIEVIQEADVTPKIKAKIARLDYQKVINDLKLQEFIAKQLLIVVELQRIAQEDDDLLTFMMMD